MKKILVVDDSKTIRKMVMHALKDKGYEFVEAVDGKEALEMYEANEFHLIISDINMPRMSGLELAEQIRSLGSRSDIPILILSTESGAEMKTKGKEIGVSAWIVKPFKDPDLNMAVEALI